jgi:hypothetical protein
LQASFLVIFCWILCVGCGPECSLPAEIITKRVTVESKFEPARVMADAGMYNALGILLRATDGHLLSVYREATTHAADRGRIVMRKSNDGLTWSEPRILFEDPILDDRNVAGGILPSGTIVVFWNTYDFLRQRAVALFYSRSSDNGETWMPPTQLLGRNNSYGPIVVLPDSVAISVGNDGEDGTKTYLHFSHDDGATWHFSRQVPSPNCEVAFISLGGSKILGFARNDSERPILRLYSENLGATWDVAGTSLRASATASSWQLVSPWIVRASPSEPQFDLWFAERLDFQKSTERGFLRSMLFDAETAVSDPFCLRTTKVVVATGTWNFGYPSVALLTPDKFVVQFYSGAQEDPADMFLISGEYAPKKTSPP